MIAISNDDPDAPEDVAAVKSFLTRQGAHFDNLIYNGKTELVEEFNVPGGLPFYELYDRQGKLRYTFSADPDAEHKIADAETRVKELLEE